MRSLDIERRTPLQRSAQLAGTNVTKTTRCRQCARGLHHKLDVGPARRPDPVLLRGRRAEDAGFQDAQGQPFGPNAVKAPPRRPNCRRALPEALQGVGGRERGTQSTWRGAVNRPGRHVQGWAAV